MTVFPYLVPFTLPCDHYIYLFIYMVWLVFGIFITVLSHLIAASLPNNQYHWAGGAFSALVCSLMLLIVPISQNMLFQKQRIKKPTMG